MAERAGGYDQDAPHRGTHEHSSTDEFDKGRYDVPALDHTARLTGVV